MIVDALGPDLVAVRRHRPGSDGGLMPVDPNAARQLGQRHHRRPAAAVAADVPRDPRARPRLVGGVRVVVRAVRERLHRRLPRPPPRHHLVGCVPRSARRQGARARGDVHARRARHVLDAAGGDHRRPRVHHQHLPHGRQLEGRQRSGQQARQVEDVRAAAGRRVRAVAVVRRRRRVGVDVAAVDRRSCCRCSSGAHYLWYATRAVARAGAARQVA